MEKRPVWRGLLASLPSGVFFTSTANLIYLFLKMLRPLAADK